MSQGEQQRLVAPPHVFAGMSVPLAAGSPDRMWMYTNEAACEAFGMTAEELVGTPILDRLAPEDRQLYVRQYDSLLESADASRLNRRWTMLRGDGGRFLVDDSRRVLLSPSGDTYMAISFYTVDPESGAYAQMLDTLICNSLQIAQIQAGWDVRINEFKASLQQVKAHLDWWLGADDHPGEKAEASRDLRVLFEQLRAVAENLLDGD